MYSYMWEYIVNIIYILDNSTLVITYKRKKFVCNRKNS